jgi:hypothetical protein
MIWQVVLLIALRYNCWVSNTHVYEGIEHKYEDFRHSFGHINAEIIPLHLPQLGRGEVKALSLRKEAVYRQILGQTHDLQPLPGVLQWMERFLAAGDLETLSWEQVHGLWDKV